MSWRENVDRNHSRGGRDRGGYQRGGGFRGGYQGRSFNKRSQSKRSVVHHHGNPTHDGKRPKFEVSSRLKEVDIGVTEFIGDHEHFIGIVKERFSDFHVHEIALDGTIAKLTTQDVPEDPLIKIDYKLLSNDMVSKLTENIEAINNADSDVNSYDFDVTDMTKEQRRVVHQIVKQHPSIISETIGKDNKKFMTLTKHNSKTGASAQRYKDNRVDWSQREGDFCHFLLHKVNMDTMDALNQLAMYLRLKPHLFSYAGTKDRRARTTQWVSIKRITPKRILAAANRVHGIYVGNFKFSSEPLKLGMLSGNRFTIALRNPCGSDDEIKKAMTSLRDNGFINYYGLQRFGSVAAIPTHEIGKALLQRKWNEAINLILKPRVGEREDMTEAREIYAKTKDAGAALKRMHRLDKIEAKLLRGIQVNGPKNPQGALDCIPKNTRLMYIHAYQSYVWNHIVSRRIREYGRNPIVGDLVYEKPDNKDDSETLDYLQSNDAEDGQEKLTKLMDDESEKTSDDIVDSANSSSVGEKTQTNTTDSDEQRKEVTEMSEIKTEEQTKTESENTMNDNAANDIPKKEDEEEIDLSPLPAVKILNEEDLQNYSLADIVLPQPGWRVIYPAYAKVWYEEFLANDGLNTDLRQKNKKYSLCGVYRKILQVPDNLTWKIINYKEIRDELIRSDVDAMKGNDGPTNDPDGKYKALILEMSLKTSTYATMALREILKHDTSAETQAAQSAAYHAQDEARNKIVEDEVKKVSEDVENKMEIGNEEEEIELPIKNEIVQDMSKNGDTV